MPEKRIDKINGTGVLLVSNDRDFAGKIRMNIRGLPGAKYQLDWASSLKMALKRMEAGAVDVVLLDFNTEDSLGADSVTKLMTLRPGIPVIMLAGEDQADMEAKVLEKGAGDFILKADYCLPLITRIIDHAMERKTFEKRESDIMALVNATRQARDAVEAVEDGMMVIGADGRIVFTNPGMEKFLNVKEQDLKDKKFTELIEEILPEEKAIPFVGGYNNIIYGRGRKPLAFYLKGDGTGDTFIAADFTMARNKGNTGSGVVLTVKNITTHQKAREEEREQQRSILDRTVKTLAMIAERHDVYTAGHQQRVSMIADIIAREMQLDGNTLEGIHFAALFHDLGKIYIPTDILNRPSRITDIEFNIIKVHTEQGFQLLKDIDFPWPIPEIVLQHHERVDGSGYPRGRTEDDTLMEAKILAVADVLEAMTHPRPYRTALDSKEAIKEVFNHRGTYFNTDVVDAVVQTVRNKKLDLEAIQRHRI